MVFLTIRPPPRSTRTDTLFPFTTLLRSCLNSRRISPNGSSAEPNAGTGLPRRLFPRPDQEEVTMATTAKSKSTGESKAHSDQKTALSWNNGNTGVLVGAAVAGAAVGLAANAGRKLFMQFGNVTAGDWLDRKSTRLNSSH